MKSITSRGSARTLVVVGLLVGCAAIFVWRGLPTASENEPSPSSSPTDSAAAIEPSSAPPLARTSDVPSANPTPLLTTAPLSDSCKRLLHDLKDLDIRQLTRNTSLAVDFPATQECNPELSDELKEDLRKYQLACDLTKRPAAEALSDKQARERNQACLLTLLTLRAKLGAAELAHLPTAAITDTKQLEDRLVSALAKGDVHQTLETAKRILEIDSRHRGASRAVMTSYIQMATEYNGDRRDPFWKEVRQAVRTGMKAGGLDQEEVIRARLYSDYLQHKNAGRLMRLSDAAAADFPSAAAPYFFKAIAAFEKNRKPEAIAYLQEYGRRSNDPDANATIGRIQAGNTQPFQISFSAQIDLLSAQAD